MADKNLYINDLIHRFPSHTFTETAVSSHTNVVFKDVGSITVGESTKLSVVDAYRSIRSVLLEDEDPEFLATTVQRDALLSPETGLIIYNLTTNQVNVFNGASWDTLGNGGTIIFGAEFESFESTTQSSTSSGVFQVKLAPTTSIKPSGKYRIAFYADVTNSSGGNTTNVEFSIDGISVNVHDNGADYYEIEAKNNNDWQSLSAVQFKTLTSQSTIDIGIKFANGSGTTARISNTIIEIWRVV